MRWTEARRSAAGPLLVAVLLLAIGLAAVARPPAPEEKHLTVFDVHGRFNVPVADHAGREYVSLSELLEPLGDFSAKQDGNRLLVHFRPDSGGDRQVQLTAGKATAKIGNATVELGAPFWLQEKAGWVPLNSLTPFLTALGVREIEFHPQGRRLLIGNVAIRFQAEFQSGPEPKLVFHFTAPVDPTIANEPGKLRMTFHRSPVVGVWTQTFDDKLISSAAYIENNGEAEITVNAGGSVMATFSPDAKTITVSAPPQASPATPAPAPAPAPSASQPASPPATPAAPTAAPTTPVGTPSPPVAPAHARFLVAIDAAHGGTETGATLPGGIAEKDLTLAIARRLQAEFDKQGIATLMIRDGDSTLATEQRAIAANTARATLYVTVHVAAEGQGARIYTARMAPPATERPQFLPWATAQSFFLDASRTAAGSIAAEFSKRQLPVAAYSALLPPLNNIAGAAVAIEVAPLGNSLQTLSTPAYQQAISSAIVAGVAAVRTNLEASR